jgi:surfactin synthase thioesterase subunit
LSGLIVSGKKPPHLALESIVQSVQSDNFKEEVLKLGGFPKEFAPVFQLFAPLLKSDLGLLQTYEGSNENYAIDCALHTFYGKEDKLMKEEEVEQWRRYCKNEGDFSFHSFEGGHFFIQEKQVQVIGAINTIADSAIKHYKNLGMGE